MDSPLIGISTRARDGEGRYALSGQYIESVRRAGGIPVLIPPGDPRIKTLLTRIDGLLLSGGGDIDPSLYGGLSHKEIYSIDMERDQSEIDFIRQAVSSRFPVLGICRGIQVMNVALGGTLIEHLPDVVGEAVPHRSPEKEACTHSVKLLPDSLAFRIFNQTELSVLSYHHQAIRKLASPLRQVAASSDGIIEAVEMPGYPFLMGVQWHPELSQDPLQQKLFDAFVEAAREKRAEGKTRVV